MGMDRTISNFIRALRNADVRVSTAETLDAISAVELVGYKDKEHLKRSLSMVLPKTADEKVTFDTCFDQFFRFQDVRGESTNNSEDSGEQEGEESGEGGDGEGGGAGGDPQAQNRSKKKSKAKRNNLYEEEEEADLGPGEVTDAHSPLGKLLMADSRVELAQSMAEAGEATNVREIQIFTQKGLYARRIMDHMGLADLNREISDLRTDSRVPATCAQTLGCLHAVLANSSSSDAIFCASKFETMLSNSSCSTRMCRASACAKRCCARSSYRTSSTATSA